MNIRKTLRSLHRDFGYFVVGITFIYTVSGIALNHRTDWNPHYSLVTEDISVAETNKTDFAENEINVLLNQFETKPAYKKHFVMKNGDVKIFVEEGSVLYNSHSGEAHLEILKKRPFWYQINKIHLAQASRTWIWISDVMAAFLLFVALSGLFILKGKYGLSGRGAWLTGIGIVIPLIVILLFLS